MSHYGKKCLSSDELLKKKENPHLFYLVFSIKHIINIYIICAIDINNTWNNITHINFKPSSLVTIEHF